MQRGCAQSMLMLIVSTLILSAKAMDFPEESERSHDKAPYSFTNNPVVAFVNEHKYEIGTAALVVGGVMAIRYICKDSKVPSGMKGSDTLQVMKRLSALESRHSSSLIKSGIKLALSPLESAAKTTIGLVILVGTPFAAYCYKKKCDVADMYTKQNETDQKKHEGNVAFVQQTNQYVVVNIKKTQDMIGQVETISKSVSSLDVLLGNIFNQVIDRNNQMRNITTILVNNQEILNSIDIKNIALQVGELRKQQEATAQELNKLVTIHAEVKEDSQLLDTMSQQLDGKVAYCLLLLNKADQKNGGNAGNDAQVDVD